MCFCVRRPCVCVTIKNNFYFSSRTKLKGARIRWIHFWCALQGCFCAIEIEMEKKKGKKYFRMNLILIAWMIDKLTTIVCTFEGIDLKWFPSFLIDSFDVYPNRVHQIHMISSSASRNCTQFFVLFLFREIELFSHFQEINLWTRDRLSRKNEIIQKTRQHTFHTHIRALAKMKKKFSTENRTYTRIIATTTLRTKNWECANDDSSSGGSSSCNGSCNSGCTE